MNNLVPIFLLAVVAAFMVTMRRWPVLRVTGIGGLAAATFMAMSSLGLVPTLPQIAAAMSGNVLLDGATLFFVGGALLLWLARLVVVVEYAWFYNDGSYERYHHEGCSSQVRWVAMAAGFLMICIQVAAYLSRLR